MTRACRRRPDRMPVAARHGAWLALALILLGGTARPAEPNPDLIEAERALREARVAVDGPALLEFFRARTLSEAEQARLAATVRLLGDDSFPAREKASRDLVRAGRVARPYLRRAVNDPDLEIARRAERCLHEVEQGTDLQLVTAAARVLADRKPAGAARVLLGYLPMNDDEGVEEAVLDALPAVGAPGGKADPALVKALADKEPLRRAAAARALGAVPGQRPAVRRLLDDAEPRVRYETAAALVRAGDKVAVPTLVALLGEGPETLAGQSEDLLARLAGDQAPPVTLAGDAAARRRCRQAWEAWWKANGAKADLARLGKEEAFLGLNVVCEHNESGRTGAGRVWACGRDGKARWEFDSVTNPVDVQLLPNGRLLVAEHQGRRITERDRTGRVLWEQPLDNYAVSCQRLANGNTLIATSGEVLEVTRGKKTVFSSKQYGGLYGAWKVRNGHILVGYGGGVAEMDASGKEVRRLAVPGMGGWGRVELLPNGHFLTAQYTANQVVELDATGRAVSTINVRSPTSATRLRNGHTLVASAEGHQLLEFDRGGKEVWKQAATGRPFRLRRY